jgi:hypothetical protein
MMPDDAVPTEQVIPTEIPMKATVLRHFTAEPYPRTNAPSSPTVVPLGHKTRTFNTLHRTATTGTWQRYGSLYFERRRALLFVARSPEGPYVHVPDWALIAWQWIPEHVEDIQSTKPLMFEEPGRQRRRKATEGEWEMVAIVALRQYGKAWMEISKIVGIPLRTLVLRRQEIRRVIRDIDQLGNTETVFLAMCQQLNDQWRGHIDDDTLKRGKHTKKAAHLDSDAGADGERFRKLANQRWEDLKCSTRF